MAITEPHASLDDAVVSHYHLAAPIMEQLLGQIPIVWVGYPKGPNGPGYWHIYFYGRYTKLTTSHVVHLAQIGAREFNSWSPVPDDPSRCRFVRLLVVEHPGLDRTLVKEAAVALRSLLLEEGRDAVPVLDGLGNVHLWVPVRDGPTYDKVLAWCHTIARRAVERYPNLVSIAPNTHCDGRAHLHVGSNAERRCSVLPYSYREETGYIATPIAWNEFERSDLCGVSRSAFPAHLKQHGDLFAHVLAGIHASPLLQAGVLEHMAPELAQGKSGGKRVWNNAKGALLSAVVDILSDGKPRTCDEILASGVAAKTIDPHTDARALYIDLTQNIAREKGRGHKPLIEDADRRFRINEPLDAWPIVPVPPTPAPSSQTQVVIDRLHATSHGNDPTAFEVAVCDAFTTLGYLTTHLGGVGNPDGYLDAPLGVLGYRAMLECKSGVDIQKDQTVFEAAKYRDAYNAQYCILVGPQSGPALRHRIRDANTRRERVVTRRNHDGVNDRRHAARTGAAFPTRVCGRQSERYSVGAKSRRT